MAVRRVAALAFGLALAGCATTYGDRGGGEENPLKNLAALGGLATKIPDAKDFVKESRPEKLDYIPIGVPSDDPKDRQKPMTPEELLLLQKRLDAARKQNGTATTSQ